MSETAIDVAGLAAALRGLFEACHAAGDVAIVARRPNEYASSSRGEIVTVRLPSGIEVDLFLKHARDDDPAPRCRHGVEYCAAVNRHLVDRLPLPHAAALGLVHVGATPVLVVEHVAGSLRVGEAPDESGVVAAAEWCGRFHAWGETVLDDAAFAFLVRHDEAYYRAWGDRAREVAAAVGACPPWLERACEDFATHAAVLAAAPRTTIHGEFGPQNVLWCDGEIRPVDWESAAVGPGEIDLATLLFGWPAATVDRCIEAYWRARGVPQPAAFASTCAAATLYTALRWVPPAEAGGAAVERALATLERAWRSAGG